MIGQGLSTLRVYCGYDATKPDLHLGHTVSMRKLRQFQDFGHEVTFLIGDFTTRVGDPSDKDKLRPQLSEEEIAENARTYADQAFKVLVSNFWLVTTSISALREVIQSGCTSSCTLCCRDMTLLHSVPTFSLGDANSSSVCLQGESCRRHLGSVLRSASRSRSLLARTGMSVCQRAWATT